MLNGFWDNLSKGARVSLVVSVLLLAGATGVAGWWLLKTEYRVLFADLTPQDSAAIVTELERLKTPYQLGDNGTTILVDKDAVHRVRLKVMDKELPLHGAVGFELFNNTDFGMTEFAQKINYQRALQGELTRTIMALAEIRDVRVHLALPEQGLFRQQNNRPKAAITVTLKPGQLLHKDQITGIQRLVAAAMPGMAVQDVTIVDQHGVALTRAPSETEGDSPGGSQLDLKKETEQYLARKVAEVLDKTFGAGQTVASVDATLNMDQVRATQESVVAPPAKSGQTPTGVIVRERESIHESGAPLDVKAAEAAKGGSSQHELDYQVGRRVEQIVSQPGSIQHLHVVAVVYKSLSLDQLDQVRRIVATTAGLSEQRGDTVEVQCLDGLATPAPAAQPEPLPAQAAAGGTASAPVAGNGLHPVVVSLGGLAVLVVLTAVLLAARRRSPAPPALSDAQRRAALEQVQHWLRRPHEAEDVL
ncbi:flagellar M-ring protein FliF [Duganella sacchari]|uniref:Flagellar M-ring protein FliF n=1 Tax=Duganella sacchari TaxID=551987 RepID=A0A1M7PLF0_9BURK|nr:flagellar basal-body MS-ring/collar protein FliF [Duganella sacchari]SHN18039.1 flagellar M-ring protein FliF [Duganella sacchari]